MNTTDHGFSDPPRLLLVEDDRDTAALMEETLTDHFGPGGIVVAYTLHQALEADLDHTDLVLSDMNLPDGTGLDLLAHLARHHAELPMVLITAEGKLDTAIESIRRGAYDYVVKAGDYLFALPVVVEKNLALHRIKRENQRLVQQLERTNRRLAEAAATDPLTGLANRRAFNDAIETRFSECQRYGNDLALIVIDLDGFKQLNDTLGHQEGDALLIEAATALRVNCRRSDIAGRFGGDEFVLLMPQTDQVHACEVADRVRHQFDQLCDRHFRQTGYDGRLTMSMGLTTLRAGLPDSPEQMIAQADHAMYAAKNSPPQLVGPRMHIYQPPRDAGDDAPATPAATAA